MAEKHEDARDPKAGHTVGVAAKTWHTANKPNAAAAAAFLNQAPAQQGGEAFASNRSDGTVDVYAFF